MKKISLIAILMAAFFCLNSCDSQFNSTPEQDKTLLWPAKTDTCALWGYINEKGEMVIPAQYKNAGYFSCGRAKVILDNDCQAFIDEDGHILYISSDGENCDDYFYYGYCRFSNSTGLYGMFDTNFNVVIPNEYTSLGRMTKEGLVSTEKGYIDKEGKTVLVLPYAKNLGNFCDGVAVVTTWEDIYEEDYWGSTHYRYYKDGAIDTQGKLVIDTIYEGLFSVGKNRLVYAKNGKGGLLDTRGNVITDPMYDNITWYGEGDIMPVRRGERWMYVDKNGKMAFSELYKYAVPFRESVACVTMDHVKEEDSPDVLINRQGNIIFSLKKNQYWESTYHNGLAMIFERTYEEDEEHYSYKEEYKYIDKKGKTVYSWVARSENYNYYAPAKTKKEVSEDEKLLRMFEGTEYYPLAEQCVRRRQECENLKK